MAREDYLSPRPRGARTMPATQPLGDDFARFELRENIVAHLKALPCPAAPEAPWPGGTLEPASLSPIALGDPHALQVGSPDASFARL